MKTFLLSIGTIFMCCATLVAEQPSNPSHATAPQTQTINTITSFTSTSGQPDYPTGVLAQGFDGNLYGAAQGSGFGTIYQITPAGAVSTLHVFDVNNDGYSCFYGVTLGRDGNLYGTCQTINSGTGSVWTLNLTTNAFTRLHIFTGPDGIDPLATLTQGADGNFYGTVNSTTSGNPGAVFKITPTGTFTTIHTFAGGPNDGGFPTGVLFLSRDGNFYGVTSSGGANSNNGTVYKMTPAGKVTILHSFNGTDGSSPFGGVIEAANGSLYGTTQFGGTSNQGVAFKLTKSKTYTLLHNFSTAGDYGLYPAYALTQATDGNLYGIASNCGPSGCANNGSIFKISTKNVFSEVVDFADTPPNTNGVNPSAPLFMHTNGQMYCTTQQGGFYANGSFCNLTPGVNPFVKVQTRSGNAGTSVNIQGQGFTGATAVAFNKIPATFVVISDTLMTATIPAGVKTGYVTVTTPSGVLKSNEQFRGIH